MNKKSGILIAVSIVVAIVLIFGMWSIGVNNSVKRKENDLQFRISEIESHEVLSDQRISMFIQTHKQKIILIESTTEDLKELMQRGQVMEQNGELLFLAYSEAFPDGESVAKLAIEGVEGYSDFIIHYASEINRLQGLISSYNITVRDYKNTFVTFPNSMFLGGKQPDPIFQNMIPPRKVSVNHSNIWG